MFISHIVAMSNNRVIGNDNKLPWHLPEDLKYFKGLTMSKPIIMGRKTWESIGKPLPGRTNIVITRSANYSVDGIKVVNSLDEAYALCTSLVLPDENNEVMIIGGGEIFRESLSYTRRIYLTQVHAELEGDTYYPELPQDEWKQVSAENHSAEGKNPYDYSFVVLERMKPV